MSGESDGGEWAASEFRDAVDGRHRRDVDVWDHATEVRKRSTRQTLSALRAAYDRAYARGWLGEDAPASIEDVRRFAEIRKHHGSEQAARAVENGDAMTLRSMIGSQSDEVDVSGWHDIERIRNVVSDQHLRLYIYGEPGNGKTRSGCLAARHWLEQQRDEGNDDAIIVTNIRTLADEDDAIKWVQSWGELKEIVDADLEEMLNEDVRPVLFLFDEASSHAGGGGQDGWDTSTKLATLVYKMRKFGAAIIIIGHDGKDLHPAVRELCIVLHKIDKKIAQFFKSITNRNPKDPITPRITGWPDSHWQPNDKDPAPWSWAGRGEADDEDEEHITREDAFKELAIWTVVREKLGAKERGDSEPSFNDIAAKRLSGAYSGEWCRQRWHEYQDGELDDVFGRVERVIA